MTKREQMIIEIARLYKGITVESFFRMFGGMTANELEDYLQEINKKGESL